MLSHCTTKFNNEKFDDVKEKKKNFPWKERKGWADEKRIFYEASATVETIQNEEYINCPSLRENHLFMLHPDKQVKRDRGEE